MNRHAIRALSADELEDAVADALDSLSDRQRLFCENVVSGMSQTEALKQAGYSAKSAGTNSAQVTRSKGVKLTLALLRERASRSASTSADWVRMQLRQNVRDARTAGDLKCVVSTLREISRIDGHYSTGEIEVSHEAEVQAMRKILALIPPTVGPPKYQKYNSVFEDDQPATAD